MSSSINNYANSGYYQLSNTAGGQSGGTNAGTTAPTNLTQSLLQDLTGSSASGTSSSDAYLLSLSPAAQQYLNASGTGTSSNTSATSLASILSGTGSATSASSPLGGTESYTLTQQQQTAINNILVKYKDAPYTQATFNDIQNDLNAAGLGTNTLSLEDKAKSFNAAVVLINALNGGPVDGSDSGTASSSDEQAKSTAYMQSIISQWKDLSGNATTPSTSNSSAQSATAVAPVSSGSGA